MFIIFNEKQKVSEEVATLQTAQELLKKHKAEQPSKSFEIKVKIKYFKEGSTKRSSKTLTLSQYNEWLRKAEDNSLF